MFQGICTSIAKKPYIFVIFQGGGGSGPPVPTFGSMHEGRESELTFYCHFDILERDRESPIRLIGGFLFTFCHQAARL